MAVRVRHAGLTRTVPAATPLDRAIVDFLTYLRVERGLSPATIRAYRGDLDDFAAARGSAGDWHRTPDAALRYLAARTRRGRRNDPGLAPTSLRRRAAAAAACDAGMRVLGGGVAVDFPLRPLITESYPTAGGVGWTARVESPPGAPGVGFTVHAICVPAAAIG